MSRYPRTTIASTALAAVIVLTALIAIGAREAGPDYAPGTTPKYPAAVIEGYRTVATASVADAVDKIAGRRGFLSHTIRPRINAAKVVGPAVTVLEGPADEPLPPQHALDAIDESPAGSVIVIAINGEPDVAVWGGLMSAGAVANGHAGAILDGGLRDVEEIRQKYGFPVFSRSISLGTTIGRHRTIAANLPVEVGDVMVHPDDLVVADNDGVVIVPRARVEAVLEMARQIDEREAEQSRLILEEGSLREGLKKYGRI